MCIEIQSIKPGFPMELTTCQKWPDASINIVKSSRDRYDGGARGVLPARLLRCKSWSQQVKVQSECCRDVAADRRAVRRANSCMLLNEMNDIPAIFLSHHKCATTWLGEILKSYCAKHDLTLFGTQLSNWAPPPGQQFDVLILTNSFYESLASTCDDWLTRSPQPALHMIRNPLDLVVSAYYSHLNTHPSDKWPALAQQREILRKLDKVAGLLATWTFLERADFHHGAVGPLFALRRWNYADQRIKTLRMEDLVNDPELTRSELQNRLGRDPTDVIAEFTFEKITGGRSRGVVDDQHHYRSGNTDQWLEEMDVSLAQAIYRTYQTLIDTFYPDVKVKLQAKQS